MEPMLAGYVLGCVSTLMVLGLLFGVRVFVRIEGRQ